MTRKTQLFKIIAVCKLLAFLFIAISYGQQYRAIKLVHPDGKFYASGMNNLGQVCGSVLVDELNFINHAVRYEQDSTFTTLTLGDNGNSATASDMNEYGHVIGTINTTDFTSRVVIWESDSTFRELSQPEGFISIFPKDVNNQGEAVGHTLTSNPKAYFWDSEGNYHELPQRGYGAEAIALNDSSQIGGRIFNDTGNSIPALWQPVKDTGNGLQEFELVELDEPSPNARINDISNAIFPVPANDSTLETRKSGTVTHRRVLLAGYARLPLFNFNTATIYTTSGDRTLPDDGEFESEIYSIGNDLTFYGFGSNKFGGFDGVAWRQIGFKLPSFTRYRFNDLGGGTIISGASGGNFSGMFLGGPQGDNTLWLANDRAAVSSILGTNNWELGNSNRPAPDFNIPHDLDFNKFKWGVDLSGTYQDVKFNALNDNGIHWLIGWNALNGDPENYGVPGTLDIHGLTNLGNVKLGPKVDLRLTGNGDFVGGIWNLGRNTATFFADEGEINEYKIGGGWLWNGKLSVLGAGLHRFSSDVEENSFPSTNFGSEADKTTVDISNSRTEVGGRTLTFLEEMSIRGATVDFTGFDVIETGPTTITDGDLTFLEGKLFLEAILRVFGGTLDVNGLIGNSNSMIEIGEEGQARADHVDFEGSNFENYGTINFNTLKFSNKDLEQILKISHPDSFSIQQFINDNFRTILNGILKTEKLTLNSGIIETANPGSKLIITSREPDSIPNGGNFPVSGSVFVDNPDSYFEGEFERDTEGFRLGGPIVKDKVYFFATGKDDKSSPVLLWPYQVSSSLDPRVGIMTIDPTEESLEPPGDSEVNEGSEFRFFEDPGWRVGFRFLADFKSIGATDSIYANIRIPAFGLENVNNLDQYRLLLYDCEGNFLGLAGDFMAPGPEPQSSALYTGMIDGVFNITHTNVPLDTCQYIVLASSEAPSSIYDPLVHEGYVLEQNHPNPFALHTSISYSLSWTAHVKLSVYNVLGQHIRSLVAEKQAQGDYTVEWDGTNDSGEPLSSGIYFCRMEIRNQEIGHMVLSRKMVLN